MSLHVLVFIEIEDLNIGKFCFIIFRANGQFLLFCVFSALFGMS